MKFKVYCNIRNKSLQRREKYQQVGVAVKWDSADKVFKRIKQLENIKKDVELASIFDIKYGTLTAWKYRDNIKKDFFLLKLKERYSPSKISYILTGNENHKDEFYPNNPNRVLKEGETFQTLDDEIRDRIRIKLIRFADLAFDSIDSLTKKLGYSANQVSEFILQDALPMDLLIKLEKVGLNLNWLFNNNNDNLENCFNENEIGEMLKKSYKKYQSSKEKIEVKL